MPIEVLVTAIWFMHNPYNERCTELQPFRFDDESFLGRPNTVHGVRCPSVRPQKVSSISMKFGISAEVDE